MRNEPLVLLSPRRLHHHRLPIINRNRDNSPIRVDEVDFHCRLEGVFKTCSRHSSASDLTMIEEEPVDQIPQSKESRSWKDIIIAHGSFSTESSSIASSLTSSQEEESPESTSDVEFNMTDDDKIRTTVSTRDAPSFPTGHSFVKPLILVTRHRDPVVDTSSQV